MTPVSHAVLVATRSAPWRLAVRHLYQHRPDAGACARAYLAGGFRAEAATIRPALALQRDRDTWCTFDGRDGVLHAFDGEAQAQSHAAQTGALVVYAPVRRAMPVQHGIPQIPPARAA